jgi:oxygen-independent coproporphyrinogen-3 oxidase
VNEVKEGDLAFEFMLNALRLTEGVSNEQFIQRTGLALQTIEPIVVIAKQRGLMREDSECLGVTELGMKFLNDVTAMFLGIKI